MPGTLGVSMLTPCMNGSRCRRTRERLTSAGEKRLPSSWRISRRSTSSRVLYWPSKRIRLTYTRLPGTTRKSSATVRISSFSDGTTSTSANAKPSSPSRSVMRLVLRTMSFLAKVSPSPTSISARSSSVGTSTSPPSVTSLTA